MSTQYENGPLTQWNSVNSGVIPYDVFGVAINWHINRAPLTTRLDRLSTGAASFKLTNDDYRPRQLTMATGGLTDGSGTTLTLTAATMALDVGDVLQVENEYLLV